MRSGPVLYLVLVAPVVALGLLVSMAAVERWQQRGSERRSQRLS
jgi:hypothetical protein